MINGRNIEEEKKRIDEFFDKLSPDEFENMLIEAGGIPNEKTKQVTCDICNFVNQEGVMGFDGCSFICRNEKSDYYGKEVGFFSCKNCYVGETSLPYELW